MVENAFQTCPPVSETLTEYDEQHLVTYLRLLDADKDGADWKEVVSVVFGIDPDENPESAKMLFERHLERAMWLSHSGYKHLLNKE